MKFEDFIKQQVEQHQEPYNPAAWSKLSAKMNLAGKGLSSTLKWLVASSFAVAVAITGFILLNNKENKPAVAKTLPSKTNKEVVKPTAEAGNNTSAPIAIEKEKEILQNTPISKTAITQNHNVKPNNPIKTLPQEVKTPLIEDEITFAPPSYDIAPEPYKVYNTPKFAVLAIPAKFCKGENIVATNKNNNALFVQGKENSLTIEAKQSFSFANLNAGNYTVQTLSNKIIQSFEIVEAPRLDFIADNIVYEKGLPFIPVKLVNNDIENINWSINNQTISSKKEALVPAFDKGGIKVKFTGSTNGCAISESYVVTINEDYNLLAVSAFNIDSRDERNRTFLPNALYERSEDFEMQIIDPKNNQVIYSTRSTSEPWNGIDKKTGELVAPNTRYIWTVRLSEKANYETKAVYQGVVIRVTY